MSQITIRSAECEDIPSLIGLLQILFSIEKDFIADQAKQRRGLEIMLKDKDSRQITVAEVDRKVIGMCTAQMFISTAEGGPVAQIEDLVIEQAYRGKGIGRDLLLSIQDWAVEKGASRLQLLADQNNTPALDFYKKMGWKRTELISLHQKDFSRE